MKTLKSTLALILLAAILVSSFVSPRALHLRKA